MRRTKSATIFARVEPELLEAVERAAEMNDRTCSEVVRICVLSAPKRRLPPKKFAEHCERIGFTADPDELL